MNIKRIVIASVAAAGIAGVAFGGEAVSTAFTSSSSGHVNATTANISHNYATGDLVLDKVLPGESGPSQTIAFTNDGDTPVNLVLTIGNQHGSDALAQDITVVVDGVGSFPLTAAPSTAALGKIQPGHGFSATAHLVLNNTAGDEALNKAFAETYTLTATATR